MPKKFPNDLPLERYASVFKNEILGEKFAFITGGGSGINFRITEGFMRHGCHVAIASRSIDRVRTAADRLMAKYPQSKCLAFSMDVTNSDAIDSTIDKILKEYPRIDILVNGAAGNFLCFAEDMSMNAFKKVIAIDTVGTFNTCQSVFKKCMKKNGGVILNITATLDFSGTMMQAHAGPAKAAINALTRHLAVEWGEFGIRVNSVAPGPIDGTAGLDKLGGFLIKDGVIPSFMSASFGIPLGRMGTKKEIADMCVFLASDASSYTSGAVLVVDGGQVLQSPQGIGLLAKTNPQIYKMITARKTKHKESKRKSKL